MGNCLGNNKISAQEFEPSRELGKTIAEAVEETKKSAASESESKKKRVSFKSEEGDGGSNSRSEPVRIRLLVTREELRRILNYENDPENNTSLEQLLKGRKISEVGKDDGVITVNPAWRPTLESIPEERPLK